MSDFKFACPVCGQHITADAASVDAQIECPTCFQRIIVPQAPTSNGSALILTASQPHAYPVPLASEAPRALRRSSLAGTLATLSVAALALAIAAWALVATSRRTHNASQPQGTNPAVASTGMPGTGWTAPPASGTNWQLDLENVTIPETHAAGRINGRDFICQRASLMGGMLSLRQGWNWPPDSGFGLTIMLTVHPGESLAGKTITVTTNQSNVPSITLRWREAQQSAMTRTISQGYAMRLEFGEPEDGRLPARIYLCLADELKSYVAGTFDVDLRRFAPPRPPQLNRRGPQQ